MRSRCSSKPASLGEPTAYRAAAVLLDEGRSAPKDPAGAAVEMLRCVYADSGECLAELVSRAKPDAGHYQSNPDNAQGGWLLLRTHHGPHRA